MPVGKLHQCRLHCLTGAEKGEVVESVMLVLFVPFKIINLFRIYFQHRLYSINRKVTGHIKPSTLDPKKTNKQEQELNSHNT